MNKALIVWGGWDGHQPQQCAQLFAAKLTERGFNVELSDTLEVFAETDRLAGLSLIVPCWTMGALSDTQTAGLLVAVKDRGVGLAGFHGGMGDSFRGNITYQGLVGGQFLAHPDNIKDYTVHVVAHEDPIMRGIADFHVHTEQYYMLVDPRNEVLANTTFDPASEPWLSGTVMPVVWKRQHGAGRVFYSALGHSAQEFIEVPEQLEITLRGMAWAASGR